MSAIHGERVAAAAAASQHSHRVCRILYAPRYRSPRVIAWWSAQLEHAHEQVSQHERAQVVSCFRCRMRAAVHELLLQRADTRGQLLSLGWGEVVGWWAQEEEAEEVERGDERVDERGRGGRR